jgi:hypothetical protein
MLIDHWKLAPVRHPEAAVVDVTDARKGRRPSPCGIGAGWAGPHGEAHCGRGNGKGRIISHEKVRRIQNQGLLPDASPYRHYR